MSYLRFAAMIGTSVVVMFGLMYLNTYAWEHVFFSETRTYMAILMGASMAIIMLAYMLGMYKNTKLNIGIFIGSAAVFALSLWLVRSQTTVDQTSYMRAMIPHHSIAIMTSERAGITDPRVRKLADEIIEAQEREIAEMRYLIADLEDEGNVVSPATQAADSSPDVVPLSEALNNVVTADLHPEPMSEAEASQVLASAPGCAFSWTEASAPILIARAAEGASVAAGGLMKLKGNLVPLRSEAAGGSDALLAGPTMIAEGARISVRFVPDEDPVIDGSTRRHLADLIFELEQEVVGYRGFYSCDI